MNILRVGANGAPRLLQRSHEQSLPIEPRAKSTHMATDSILTDFNYNKLLVQKSKVSFGQKELVDDNSKLVSSLASSLEVGEYIIIGKSPRSSYRHICRHSDSLIKKIYFIKDDFINGSLVIHHKPHEKGLSITNNSTDFVELNDTKLFHHQCIYLPEAKPKKGTSHEIAIDNHPRIMLNLATTEPVEEADNLTVLDLEELYLSKNKRFKETFNRMLIEDVEGVKTNQKKKEGITFDDIGGLDEVISEMKKSILYPMKYPFAFKNRPVNHGVLLYGKPGTGKTLLAKALATEAGATFIQINGAEYDTKWVGDTEEKWRETFEEARSCQPAIIFIDEIDSVGRERADDANSKISDKTTNQILTLLSEIEKNGDNVFVIATTNKRELLDSALIRTGRLGKHIEVPTPGAKGCKQILKIHTKDINVSKDLDLDKLAKTLSKNEMTGSDIAYIVGEAANNAYEDTGIFQKMEKGEFTIIDFEEPTVTEKDFEKTIKTFLEQKVSIEKGDNKNKRKIGFDAILNDK